MTSATAALTKTAMKPDRVHDTQRSKRGEEEDDGAEPDQEPPQPDGHAGHESAQRRPRERRQHAGESGVVAGAAASNRSRSHAGSPRRRNRVRRYGRLYR